MESEGAAETIRRENPVVKDRFRPDPELHITESSQHFKSRRHRAQPTNPILTCSLHFIVPYVSITSFDS